MKAIGVDAHSVGHTELRARLRDVLGRLREADRPVAVTNHNRVEAILVAPADFGRMSHAEEELERLRSTMPILIAALKTGVAYPADSLRGLLGTELSLDWRRMNAFQAAFPAQIAGDEDGTALPAATSAKLWHEPIEELDEEPRYA